MSAPLPATEQELRERLLDAVARCVGMDPAEADPSEVDDLMGYLLPVVERFAAEQVAAALNDAADYLDWHAARELHARAAAVLAAPDNDRSAD